MAPLSGEAPDTDVSMRGIQQDAKTRQRQMEQSGEPLSPAQENSSDFAHPLNRAMDIKRQREGVTTSMDNIKK